MKRAHKSPSEIGDLLCSKGQVTAMKSKWGDARPICGHGQWASNGPQWIHSKLYAARHKRHNKQLHRGNRMRALDMLGNACANCGSGEKLEFDHVNPETKEFSLGRWWSNFQFDNPKLQDELAKCQLLCEHCHKAKTAQERGEAATAKQAQLDALLNQYGSEAA